MMQAIGCFVFFMGLNIYVNKSDALVTNAVISLVLFYVLPFLYRKWRSSANQTNWKKQSELENINRANAAEYAHQTELRRERERMEMHTEVRIKELIATLEVQCRVDEAKMKQLTKMKEEFANRQQTDLASMLGRLEAMRAAA